MSSSPPAFRYSLEAKSPRSRAQIVRRVCERLEAADGRPRLGNPRGPVDDLFYVIISNRTAPGKAGRIFRALRQRFRPWDTIADSSVAEVKRILWPAGLAQKKATQVTGIVGRLKSDFGPCHARTTAEAAR